jgi:hypothetical protein
LQTEHYLKQIVNNNINNNNNNNNFMTQHTHTQEWYTQTPISLPQTISQSINLPILRSHQLFTGISRQIHLSASSSSIGKDTQYFHKSLVGGTAILTFGL